MKTAILALIAVLAATAAQPQGTVAGRVVDHNRAPLSGATVTVTGEGQKRQVTTDERGEFRVPGLPPGVYAVKVTAGGYYAEERSGVRVRVGESIAVGFTLMHLPTFVTFAAEGTADAWRRADAVVYLRIDKTQPWKTGQQGLSVRHDATVLSLLKAHPAAGPTGQTVTFVQAGSTTEPAYSQGEEFIAFLAWSAESGVFVRLLGPASVYPVEQGRVEWLDLGGDTRRETMKVEDFIAKLKALSKEGR